MRKTTVLAVTLGLLFGAGAPAGAGPPTEQTFTFTSFSCEFTGDIGSGFLFVEQSDNNFVIAEAQVWLAGTDPFVGEPDLVSPGAVSIADIDGDTVTAEIPLVHLKTFAPFGDISLVGTIGALLDEETFSDRFRDGNRWIEFTETIRFFEASGEITLNGDEFVEDCSAVRGEIVERSTNPHAIRVDFDEAFVECFGITGSDGSTLNLFAGQFGHDSFLDMQIFPPGGEFDPPELFGSTQIGALTGTIEVVVPLFDPFDDAEPVAQATVNLNVAEGNTTVSDIMFQHGRVKQIETELLVSGMVNVDDGRSYQLDGCFGQRFESRGIINQAEGPKAQGNPPDNDAPDGARPLELGTSVNQQTKATAAEPEEPCVDTFGGLGKTVWYAVTGTGGQITVSTSGSDFDTVVGVYVPNGGGLDAVTCVDDVFEEGFSFQAEVTWDSEPGQTYLIQAGGFLFPSANPEETVTPEYGLLKISASG